MENKMRVLLSEGYGKGSIVDMPIPEVADDMVLVKICYCGICGTDQDLYSSECSFAENGEVTYPVRLGHEWSGVVEAVGKNVTGFKKGDPVVGDNAVACGTCEACKMGAYDRCSHMLNVGTIDPVYDGAFAEYYIIPHYHLHKIPEGISLKAASLAEPLSVAYGGIKKMNITDKSTVVVIGTGCIGMAAVVLAKCLGAKNVIMVGRNPKKLEVAERLGARSVNIRQQDPIAFVKELTGGNGAEFVVECSGMPGTFEQALDMVAFRGTISLIGFYENREDGVDVSSMVSKALQIYGVMGEFDNMTGALAILEKYQPDILPIITDELPFEDCIPGFFRKNYPDAVKIAVKIHKE